MSKINFCPPRDEFEQLGRPCLKILRSNIELKDVPLDGEEYIFKAMHERKKLSQVTRCNVDTSKYRSRQSRFVKEEEVITPPEKLKPTIEWQNIQVADFSDVRMYISQVRNNVQLVKKIQRTCVDIPDDTIKCWKTFFAENEPKLTCVLAFGPNLLDRGLEALTTILEKTEPGHSIEHKTGQWIYAFMACLKMPLLADSHSILRTLAKKCAELRSQIDPEREDAVQLATPFSLFICLVGRYFGQGDLVDTYSNIHIF